MNFRNKIITTTMLIAILSSFSAFAATEIDNVKSDLKNAGTKAAAAAEDLAITTKVKALLAVEADVRSLKIHVTTTNYVVYLEFRHRHSSSKAGCRFAR